MRTSLGHLFRGDIFTFNGEKYMADYLIHQYVRCKNLKTNKYASYHLDTIVDVEKEGEVE